MPHPVAIITGGTLGIGRGLALHIARQQGVVAVTYHHDDAAASALAEDIRELGGRCQLARFDICDEQARVAFVADMLARFGRIDILVNNVGIDDFRTVLETPLADWRRSQDILLNAPFHLCQLAIPAMRAQRFGRIINIGASSKNYLTGVPGMAAFGVHKAALTVLTKTMALEEIAHGITVNMVSPGSTANAGRNPEEDRIPLVCIPIGRRVTIEEVVAAAAYFLSDAAAVVTGQVIGVNGGLST